MSTASYLGVTPPITLNRSSAEEEAITNDLLATLQAAGQFEGDEESKNREVVLGKIDRLVKEFVYKASLKHKMSESFAKTCGGKIFTFGSFRLGVHGAGADIDTLCVAPRHITREDFFEIMYELLKARSEVEELTPVPGAHVPVMKMRFGGVEIDLTFASLQLPTIPDNLELLDTEILRHLDEQSIRSVNGSRVTDEILRLVPNIPSFRLALRCIKMWAKSRAIYSNSMGFFGGVAWAMLVARICQLYPNACAGSIVAGFFHVYNRWDWPRPVTLKTIENGSMLLRVWNPKLYDGDKYHKMPIITPAYPSMCATHNVSNSTKLIIESEFKRGFDITRDIMKGDAQWTDLFGKCDFFRRYKFYLQVNVVSTDAGSFNILHGFVESRLRQYVVKLEDVRLIFLACPYVKSFDREYSCKSDEDIELVRQGKQPSSPKASATPVPSSEHMSAEAPLSANASSTGLPAVSPTTAQNGDSPANVEKKAFTSAFYIGLLLTEREKTNGKSRLDLSFASQFFIHLVKHWESYNDETMSISISFLRQGQLPDELFGDQPRDRVRSSSSSSSSKKTKAKSKRKQNDEVKESSSAQDKPIKRAKVDYAVVPSTSGVAAKQPAVDSTTADGSGPAGASADASAGGGQEMQAASGPTTIAAPVPPPAKKGGIKLKLLDSLQ
ncbi:polynucleotide adenylyltransferase [Coemansia thaxteri]|uniref:Poly(A) polymerase n=1 Tax=Coemansia thaxteri TaxID=2663907 RepID=A0A9W8BLU0_9FUNG|nr:polynucleotide adenylyltransferase [Coemansia thaxteri]KAJ2487159.1 polynucleotide adenylyltransferase [Coemansia sp. RSA 2320]